MISTQKAMHDNTGQSELSKSRLEQQLKQAGKQVIESFSPAEDATRKQLKLSWIQSTVTQEIFASMNNEAQALIDSAIALAVAYPTSQNHLQIINNLVRVDAIRKVINTYGRAS